MRLVGSTDNEASFAALRIMTGGLTSPKAAKIINYAVRCMNENEAYIEIGTYTGFTLCAASYQNTRVCIGIDDLSMKDFVSLENVVKEKEKVRAKIEANISSMNNKKIWFFEQDFRTIDKISFDPDTLKVGVCYVDGYHDFEQTNAALKWIEPQLADEAIIIVDDMHIPPVYGAVLEHIMNHHYFLLFSAMHTPDDCQLDEYIATGLAVIQYRRNL
jgi:hypothetical protein